MQEYSLHTHTKGFDGLNTVEQMTLAAQQLGWSRLGISNHFIIHPGIKSTNMYVAAKKLGYSSIYSENFEEAIQKMQRCFDEIERVRDQTDFPVYKSIEVDFFNSDEWKKGFEKALHILKPDYIIGSAHFIERNGTLLNTHDILKLSPEEKDIVILQYWENIRQAVKYGAFDFMAHLDLLKRRSIGVEEKWIDEEAKTVETITQYKTSVEINTAGMQKESEPNPSLRILKLLSSCGVSMFLSDDAHNVKALGQYYEQTEKLLKQNNLILTTPPLVIAKHSQVPQTYEEKQYDTN